MGWLLPVFCNLHLEDWPAAPIYKPVPGSHHQGPKEPFSPCLDVKAGLRSKSIQKNSWTLNTLETSSKSSFPLYFAGSIYLQCCPNDSAHNGKLCFPKMGPRGWLVHGFVFYGADTRLYGIHVSNPERLLKTGKSLFFLTAWFHLLRPVHTDERLVGSYFLLYISCGLTRLALLFCIELKKHKNKYQTDKTQASIFTICCWT